MDPKEYLETQVLGADPVDLVRMLYRGAIGAIEDARNHLKTGDIMARGNSVNKAMDILSELALSLDQQVGGEFAVRLGNLYSYIQRNLIRAHVEQSDVPLAESAKLLGTLLEGWDEMKSTPAPRVSVVPEPEPVVSMEPAVFAMPYGGSSYASSSAGRSWEL